jgi:hypothetical protein
MRPPRANTSISVGTKAHPERPPPLLSLGPVFRWRQALLDVQPRTVESIESEQERKAHGPSGGLPRSRKVHALKLVVGQEHPRLAMGKGDDALSIALHLVGLGVSPRSAIKLGRQGRVLVADRRGQSPHSISQTNRRSHCWCQVHCGEISRSVNHWYGRMDFSKVYLVPGR